MKISAIAVAAAIACLSLAEPSFAKNEFNFNYAIEGSLPISQAFNDGRFTYIQGKSLEGLEYVYVTDASGGTRPVVPTSTQPYLQVAGVYKSITLTGKNGKSTVTFTDNLTPRPSVAVENTAHSQPVGSAFTQQPRSFALSIDNPPVIFEEVLKTANPSMDTVPGKKRVGGTQSPVEMFGEARPINLEEDNLPTDRPNAAALQFDSIPFAVGRTTLGPKGRAAIDAIAGSARGRKVKIAISRDEGAPLLQSKLRGRAVRAELIKRGISAEFFDGGEARPVNGIIPMRYAFESIASAKSVASVVVQNFGEVQAGSTPTPQVVNQATAHTFSQQHAAQPGEFKSEIDKLQSELDAAAMTLRAQTDRLIALTSQNLLTDNEFKNARARLQDMFDTSTQEKRKRLNSLREKQLSQQEYQAAIASHTNLPKIDLNAASTWEINASDRSVRSLFQRWAKGSNWNLIWDLPNDFTINATAKIDGSIEQAVNTVLQSLRAPEAPIVATFFAGNRVVKISTKDNQ